MLKKQNKNPLLNDAIIYTASNFLVAILPLFLIPIFTRYLSPDEYGTVGIFTMCASLLSVGVSLNMHGAISVRFSSNSPINYCEYISTALAISLASSLALIIAITIFGEIISDFLNVPRYILFTALFVSIIQFPVLVVLAIWQARGLPIFFGGLRLFNVTIESLLSIILVVVLSFSSDGRVGAILIGWLGSAFIAFIFLQKQKLLVRSFSRKYAKDALAFGVPLIPHAIGGIVLSLADRAIVANALDMSSTGIYILAIQLGLAISLTSDSINKAFAPWLMSKLDEMSDELKSKVVSRSYFFFMTFFAFSIIFSYLVGAVIPIFIGREYHGVASILIYIFIGNSFTGMYYVVTNYIFFAGKTAYLSLLTSGICLFSAFTTWHLVKSFGLTGAAAGFMLGQMALFIGAWVLAYRSVPMPWFSMLGSMSEQKGR